MESEFISYIVICMLYICLVCIYVSSADVYWMALPVRHDNPQRVARGARRTQAPRPLAVAGLASAAGRALTATSSLSQPTRRPRRRNTVRVKNSGGMGAREGACLDMCTRARAAEALLNTVCRRSAARPFSCAHVGTCWQYQPPMVGAPAHILLALAPRLRSLAERVRTATIGCCSVCVTPARRGRAPSTAVLPLTPNQPSFPTQPARSPNPHTFHKTYRHPGATAKRCQRGREKAVSHSLPRNPALSTHPPKNPKTRRTRGATASRCGTSCAATMRPPWTGWTRARAQSIT